MDSFTHETKATSSQGSHGRQGSRHSGGGDVLGRLCHVMRNLVGAGKSTGVHADVPSLRQLPAGVSEGRYGWRPALRLSAIAVLVALIALVLAAPSSASTPPNTEASPTYEIINTDAQYYGVSNSGCQLAFGDFPPFEYDFANQPGSYTWWDQAHQDCYGIAEQWVGTLSGSPTLPQSMVLWFKPGKGIAIEWNEYVFANGTYSVPYTYLGDASGDNIVNIDDYNILYNAYGCTKGINQCYNNRADYDNDGTVGANDYSLGLGQGQFGMEGAAPLLEKCPPICWGPVDLAEPLRFAVKDYGR